MSPLLYPYHPATGMRLIQAIDYIPALVPQDIYQENGEIRLENAHGSNLDWDSSETQAVGNDIYLADDDGNRCLASEAVWSEMCDESIEIVTPGRNSCPEMPNHLRNQLLEMASAAREVIIDLGQGRDCVTSCELLKKLLIERNLWEEYVPEEI